MTKSEKLKRLLEMIPNTLQSKYTIVYDQIKGENFALAEKNTNNNCNYAQNIISNFMPYKECHSFL